MFGHLVGLAVTGTPETQIDSALSTLGIDCNAVDGKPTGVSRARFRKIVVLLQEALQESPTTPGVASLHYDQHTARYTRLI